MFMVEPPVLFRINLADTINNIKKQIGIEINF